MWKRRFFSTAALVLIGVVMLNCATAQAQDSERVKARALVDAAIKMTDSDKAVKLLWQATDIDPTLSDSYVYLGLYYYSRQDFDKVAEVYKKLIKYQPHELSGYLNVGEAYMSFSPPKYEEALTYYKKAYELDPSSSFAALRLGEILAQKGNRSDAIRYLKQASADTAKNPTIASEAQKILSQMGGAL